MSREFDEIVLRKEERIVERQQWGEDLACMRVRIVVVVCFVV